MATPPQTTWTGESCIETSATPEALWRLFTDVPGWTRWNAGIQRIEIDGPFVSGTEFRMTPPGQETLTSRLVDVTPFVGFTDVTAVGDLVVRVAHTIRRIGPDRTVVTFSTVAQGPGCAEIGPMVSADFPEVLKALARLAESEQSAAEVGAPRPR